MKKIRKVWFLIVTIAIIIFAAYNIHARLREDSSGPVFSYDREVIRASIHDGDEMLMEGITASDKKDGDVTDSILVEKLSNLYDKKKRTVTYVAFDSDNHITKMERELVYVDYERPRFQLNGSLRFRAGETLNFDTIVGVQDCLDGDITNKMKILMETTVNNRLPGVYEVVYEASNSAGDTVKLPVQVEIYEGLRNEVEITLTDYLVYYDGEDLNYKDYLKSIKSGNIENYFEGAPEAAFSDGATIPKSRVTVDAQVNTRRPGVYPVYFYYENYGTVFTQGVEVMYVVVE